MTPAIADADVLHALRICGFASSARIADCLDVPVDRVEGILQDCHNSELARFREGRISGWLITPRGQARHAEQIADALTDDDARTQVTTGYALFLDHNRDVKQICTAWQMRPAADGSTAPNDHSDKRYDDSIVAQLAEHHSRCGDMFDHLGRGLPRFARYGRRLSAALQRLTNGDSAAFATPMSSSYHCVWMELHQDLLLTLGRERDDADGH